MQHLIFILHILACLALIGLVLMQQGKGADAGLMSGGGGGSQTVFGSKGAHSFLVKMTAGCALLFFITCLSLGYFANHVPAPAAVKSVAVKAKQVEKKADKTAVKQADVSKQPAKQQQSAEQ